MAILGTKKFWKPAQGAGATQMDNQILKNSGYINIQLHCVNYMSIGNFWQKTFGGKDSIALATTLKYQTTLNKYTYWEDGKRWFKHYDAIRFYVDYHPNRPTALVKDFVGIFRFNRQ